MRPGLARMDYNGQQDHTPRRRRAADLVKTSQKGSVSLDRIKRGSRRSRSTCGYCHEHCSVVCRMVFDTCICTQLCGTYTHSQPLNAPPPDGATPLLEVFETLGAVPGTSVALAISMFILCFSGAAGALYAWVRDRLGVELLCSLFPR